MSSEIAAVILAGVALAAVCASICMVARVKRQLAGMEEILREVKEGNGNRRILLPSHELAAPLAYEMNDIILSYEERLSDCRQAEETNRQLMTSLSHDVRTPLTTLIGYLDAAQRGVVEGKEREEYIATARRKAHDLKEYIDVLFDWFKLNSDEFALELENVEAGELTRDILIDWIPVFEEGAVYPGGKQADTLGEQVRPGGILAGGPRLIAYSVEIPERAFFVRLDKEGYRRILNNLIQNILSHAQADRISVVLSEEDERFQCRVKDNGIGIGSGDLAHIFDRLYKCDKGRAKKGSGLGLSIVRQLTERMGGTVRAESREGAGTEFILEFPAAVREKEREGGASE